MMESRFFLFIGALVLVVGFSIFGDIDPVSSEIDSGSQVRLIVRFATMDNPTYGAALADIDQSTEFRYASINQLNSSFGLLSGYALYKGPDRPANTYVFIFPPGTNENDLVSDYSEDENISLAEM